MEEEERTKSRMQNQNEGVVVVAWASHVRAETRIRERYSKLGGVGGWAGGDRRTEGGKQAGTRERLLHEEALAGRGFRFAGRRLFLDLAETELKHFGC